MKQEYLYQLKNFLLEYMVPITDEQLVKFGKYADFLISYNKKVNLTAIKKDAEIIEKHFLDSLAICKYITKNDAEVADVGSGAGFPGVPIKILYNDIKLTLIESIGKKSVFLNELKKEIKLDYLVLNERAEILGKQVDYREKFDYVVARAVKNLCELSEYCLPLLKVGGVFISMKGYNVEQEVTEAKDMIVNLGGQIINIFKYNLPSEDGRSVILIKKISQTSPKYPRETAKILKK